MSTEAWKCGHAPVEHDEPVAPGDEHYYNPNSWCHGGCGRALTFSERFDQITARMDAAYANRREVSKSHKPGSAEYVAADDAIETVYAALRILNGELSARGTA